MSYRMRLGTIAVVAFLVGGLVAVPVLGFAHCSPYQGSFAAVIVSNVEDADFYSSTNRINTDSQQTWGAPWCEIIDVHSVQRYESGSWVQKASKSWHSYKSTDSGTHPGYYRVWDFTGLSNGSWRYKCSAYRVSSHNQLFGTGAGEIFQHLYDTHTSYQSGSL